MDASILGIGTAVPEYEIEQADAAEQASQLCCATAQQQRLMKTLYRRAGVMKRHSVVLHSSTNGHPAGQSFYQRSEFSPDGPSTAERMAMYDTLAAPLAICAARRSLENAGVDGGEVTHLVTVSCSGFSAPGVDLAIIHDLGLSEDTSRTHIGFMGCHGALNGLRVAKAFAESRKDACVLVCAVELCTLHHQYGWDTDQIVANSLFADGAASVVVRAGNDRREGQMRMIDLCSTVLPDSSHLMRWRIQDHGFQMRLSPKVPGLIHRSLRPWLEQWLGKHGLAVDDVGSWAIHPGGPRIVEACAEALARAPIASTRLVRSWRSMEICRRRRCYSFWSDCDAARRPDRMWRWRLGRGLPWKRRFSNDAVSKTFQRTNSGIQSMIACSTVRKKDIRSHYNLTTVFYRLLWGRHIHHGLWPAEEIATKKVATKPKLAQQRLTEVLAAEAGIRPEDRVLDVGCGMGSSSVHLAAKHNCDVTGVTISSVQRRWAQWGARLHGVGGRTSFLCADAEQVELPLDSFDVVWSIECTEHLFDKPRFFQNVARWLKPGGRVAIRAWLAGSWLDSQMTQQVHRVCEGFFCPSLGAKDDYVNWMSDAGLTLTRYHDWTSAVDRTWEICGRRVRRSGMRWLAKVIDRNSVMFLDRFDTILQAYRSGAMKYGCFIAEKTD